MTLIENRMEQNRNVYKKNIQVRLAIIEIMNETTAITVKKISKRTSITITAVRNYVQDLEHAGDLITKRKGKSKKSEILDMWLIDETIKETYDQILASLPENDRARIFTLLEDKIKSDL